MVPLGVAGAAQQRTGAIRGIVYDKDFDVPLAAAQVTAVETGQKTSTTEQGHFVFSQVAPGKYTLVFTKEGYVREVRADVLVNAGQLTDVEVALAGEFTEMDEFVVQDILQAGAGTEAALLELRFESAALLDSVSAELMSQAGASDAASALRLVAGTSVQDGKYAVVRGLPDRYVSSQMNSVRLPTADEDKRAVELDQFPAAVIESIQVSKTFTPDQQGDASGGAVDVRLKGIPDETLVQFKGQLSNNTQASGRDDFLSYDGGGLSFWGYDNGERDIQYENLGGNWDGAVGVSEEDAPIDSKWSIGMGGTRVIDDDIRIGGSASFFYERDSSFYDDGIDDSYWVVTPGQPLTPETTQGTVKDGNFKTKLYDVTRAEQSVQWGGLGTIGLETENHAIGLTYLYTRTATDAATLAEDTRGKEFFFPGYDPTDPKGPGNDPNEIAAAPYIRLETLEYAERSTQTIQLDGRHKLSAGKFEIGDLFAFREPELDWTVSTSSADLYQPDKRQFAALWHPRTFNPGFRPDVPPFFSPPIWLPYAPAENFNLGNLQRIWKEIEEKSNQVAVNLTFPFEQWSEDEGYLKIGVFYDQVDRDFNQDTFSNFGDAGASFQGNWDEPWSEVFPFEDHPISESLFDVDYRGDQTIAAQYAMIDMPLSAQMNAIGGVRFESTEIGIVNAPEPSATWIEPGGTQPTTLEPGEADVEFEQDDVLPAIGLAYEPIEQITLRGSYSQTVARQTFKELTPILQQEYAGAPVFVGNPDLQMSDLENYDVRVDYRPYAGSLVSLSWFDKQVDEPIEYVQRPGDFTFTTPVNYPEGELTGQEIEVRQHLGKFWDALDGLSLGANATFIDSEVTLPADEAADLAKIGAPMTSRDMTNAPEHLYNLYLIYDIATSGTELALFYTVQGDTLVAGAGENEGNFVPSVYAKQYDTLNFSCVQSLGKHLTLQFQAKNLTNPKIEEVYRSDFTGDDVTKTSYTKGVEFSISLGAKFSF